MYSLVSTVISDETGSDLVFYGVRGKSVTVCGVTQDKSKIRDEIDKYNRLCLEECHLLDALYDFISQ